MDDNARDEVGESHRSEPSETEPDEAPRGRTDATRGQRQDVDPDSAESDVDRDDMMEE